MCHCDFFSLFEVFGGRVNVAGFWDLDKSESVNFSVSSSDIRSDSGRAKIGHFYQT